MAILTATYIDQLYAQANVDQHMYVRSLKWEISVPGISVSHAQHTEEL